MPSYKELAVLLGVYLGILFAFRLALVYALVAWLHA